MKARLLALGALAVVGLLVVLWTKLAADEDPVTPAPREPVPVAMQPTDAAPAPATGTRPRIGSGGIPMLRRPTGATPPPVSGSEAPALPPDDAPRKEPPPYWNTLRDQVFDTETWISECNERALKTGAKLNGTAAYSFTLRRQGEKIVVGATGTEYSSIPDPAISQCMQDVSRRMTFEELPDGVDALVAYRKVVLKDGVLTENWLTEFRPVDSKPDKSER